MEIPVLLLEPQQWLALALGLGHLVLLPLRRLHVSTSYMEINEGTCVLVLPFPVFFQAVVTACKLHSLSPSSLESVSKGFCPEWGWSMNSAGW